MTSSMVSSMVLFLLILLVFPHMDKALGAQEEVKKQSAEEIYHPSGFGSGIFRRIIKSCPHIFPICRGDIHIPDIHIPPPPHMPLKGRIDPADQLVRKCLKDPKCRAYCKKNPKYCHALICKTYPKAKICRPGHV
ncbi:PREDICTED: uncharacterized protein LOC104726007 isoform X2 [Camelina sativa]|uniref:Uncharacterized protein LOC104726007 isoform X2 n=1 Tax=Camelina sativa TaxID=90675 RepID=A0ABM1QPP2_CAMSA|nr:PREDICTED: uncharacterized protein LOC104726010 isoform X2 [Camelina sativa]XP_019088730.1 PREDICTED: uncharacterized protein LOC104726007 isoform X2 [Camelina sativa]